MLISPPRPPSPTLCSLIMATLPSFLFSYSSSLHLPSFPSISSGIFFFFLILSSPVLSLEAFRSPSLLHPFFFFLSFLITSLSLTLICSFLSFSFSLDPRLLSFSPFPSSLLSSAVSFLTIFTPLFPTSKSGSEGGRPYVSLTAG